MARPKRLMRWSQWNDSDMVACGQMYMDEINKFLELYKIKAETLVSQFDYVVYGLKKYNSGSKKTELIEVRFCMIGMTTEEFDVYVKEREEDTNVLSVHRQFYSGKKRGRPRLVNKKPRVRKKINKRGI